MESRRRIERSSPLDNRAASPFRTRMGAREQEAGGSKQAVPRLLPHFPARRAQPTSTAAAGPAGRTRDEHLPGVQAGTAGAATNRAVPGQRQGRSGADRLADLSKQNGNGSGANTGIAEEADDVGGFESPRLAKARAQVAKSEVLSYMQQRRTRRNVITSQNQAALSRIHDAPRENSEYDEREAAADRHVSRGAAPSAQQPAHRGYDAHRFAEDDLSASSADQSPTRHAKSNRAGAAVSMGELQAASTGSATAAATVGSIRFTVGPPNSATEQPAAAGTRVSLASSTMRSMAAAVAEGSLSEEAFQEFKRDVAARVIQAHWHRWQAWKAKLRREAEERILQQLLADDSGLTLRLLLGGSAGASSGHDTTVGLPQQGAAKPALALPDNHPEQALGSDSDLPSEGTDDGHGRETAAADVAAMARPTSAIEVSPSPAAKARTRPSTVGPAAASRVRQKHSLASPPPGGGSRQHAERRQCWDNHRDGASANDNQPSDPCSEKPTVQPSRKHAGGHAVYTFVATPRKRAIMEAETAVAAAAVAEGPAALDGVDDCSGSEVEQHCDASGYGMAATSSTPHQALAPGGDIGREQAYVPKLPQQLQPSLDADSNPAMASPALSAVTGDGPATAASASRVGSVSHSPADTPSSRPAEELRQRLQRDEDVSAEADGGRALLQSTSREQQRESAQAQERAVGGAKLRGVDEPDTCAGRSASTPSPPSCTEHGPPPPLQQVSAASPQRTARSEALQRLKQQGSQRAALCGNASASQSTAAPMAATAAVESTAPQAQGAARQIKPDGDRGQLAGVRERYGDAGASEGQQQSSAQRQVPEHGPVGAAGRAGNSQRRDHHPSARLQPAGVEPAGPADRGMLPDPHHSEAFNPPPQQQRQPRHHGVFNERRADTGLPPSLQCCEVPSTSAQHQPDSDQSHPKYCDMPQSQRTASTPREVRNGCRLASTRLDGCGPVERGLPRELQPGDPQLDKAPKHHQRRRRGLSADSVDSDGGSWAHGEGSNSDSGDRLGGVRPAAGEGMRHKEAPGSDGSSGSARAGNHATYEMRHNRSEQREGIGGGVPSRPAHALDHSQQGLRRLQRNEAISAAWHDTRSAAPAGAGEPACRPANKSRLTHTGSRDWGPRCDATENQEPGADAAPAAPSAGAPDSTAAQPVNVAPTQDAGSGRRKGGSDAPALALPSLQPASSPFQPFGTQVPNVGKAADRQTPRVDANPGGAVDTSLTAAKMTSILKYLDEVEMQAEQEANCVAVAPALLMAEPSTAAAVAAVMLPGLACRSLSPRDGGAASRWPDTAAANAASNRRIAAPSRPATAHSGASHLGVQRSAAAFSNASRGGCRRSSSHHQLADGPDGEDYAEYDDDGAASVGAISAVSGLTSRPAFLAESVYESVRAKIRRLQDDVRQRDARIAELAQEVESLQAAQRTCLLEADARLSELLAAQRAEYEAAVSRHLAFVDRLLADKEALNSRVEQLTEQLKGADDRQERAIAKLKEGWAAELRRQKDSWAATEKQRREAWMASKAAEIKDVTVKGLEGEVQKLLARHKAELSAAQQAAADEARRHLDTYVAQNEVAVRQLKERMGREAEEAVEKERAAAANRLREVSERYEQQLQTQRMRLVADADLRLEQMEQSRKEEKKRYEDALAGAREAHEARQKEAEEDWRREKEVMRKAHDKQIEALREQYETGQEGWRAAMAERARKEVAERVAAIREKLLGERNEEVQAVMTRLEAEHAAAVAALKDDFRRREEAAGAKAAAALKEARRAESKMAERFRSAGVAMQAAEERLAASDLAVQELRRELESKNTTIRWLEGQVTAAKEEAAARERDVRSLGVEKAAVAAEVAAAVARDKQQVETRLAQAQQDLHDLKVKHSTEMAAVEARVRATLAKKDEVIAGLREQLAAVAAELQGTQEVLRQQQEELGEELSLGGDAHRGGGSARRDGRY